MTALSDSRYTPHILSWALDIHHGQGCFTIHSKTQFASQVMPTYFYNRSSAGVAQYTSFTRKLNRWGFVRVKRGLEIGCCYYYTAGGRGEDATTTTTTDDGGGGGGGQRKFYRGMSMESCGELRPLLIVGTGNTNTNDSNNKKDTKSSEDTTVHTVKKMVSDMKARTKKEDKKRKRRISKVLGDNHGKGSTRGGDVHNNNNGLIEEGEEQQLSHHQSSLMNVVWRPQQLVGHQQQHQSKGETTLQVLGNECGTIGGDNNNNGRRVGGGEEQLLAAMQIEIQSQISKWDVRMRLYNQLQLELLRRSQQQQHQAQQEVTENVNTPTAAPVTYSADHQQCILANALRVLRARIDMGLLPSSSSMSGLSTTYSSTQNNIDVESNTNRSSATSPAATTTAATATATARTTPPMDNSHVHAKMHARLHELLDKGHMFDTSVGDVQLNNNNATTATPTMAVEACSNLSQLERLDSDEDQTNTTIPTKNQQRMKVFLSTRRESSSTLPPAA